MSLEGVILDWRPPFLETARGDMSLLRSPVGPRTLLAQIAEPLLAAGAHKVVVMPNFDFDTAYTSAVARLLPDVSVVHAADFDVWLDGHEPADQLMLVDPQHYPVAGYNFPEMLRDLGQCWLARHWVHLQHSPYGTRERVICDARQRVHSVQRLYEGVTQFRAAGVGATLVSVSALRQVRQRDRVCLSDLRAALVAERVPSRDLATTGNSLDLATEDGLLALNGAAAETTWHHSPPAGLTEIRPGVWVGRLVDVSGTATLHAPIILHDGVRIGDRATLNGPVVVGAEAVVEANAVVSQSLLEAHARVAAGDVVVRRVLSASGAAKAAPPPKARAWSPDEFRPAAQRLLDLYAPLQKDAPRRSFYFTRKIKRAADALLAAIGLAVLAPVLAVIALLVRITSRGPIFFGHEREGRDGRVFKCWKFRTMIDRAHAQQRKLYGANAVDGPQFKMSHDPRITTIGNILRKTNLDELPQLYNVLRGEMSLIGPRPSPFRENQICVPWRKARLSVRPGITGLWQVCRHDRDLGDFHQWIHFDMLYVRHWSLWLDFGILVATVATLGGRWSVPANWLISERKLSRARFNGTLPVAHETVPSEPRSTTSSDATVGSQAGNN